MTGTVVADERVKLGGLELRIEEPQVESQAEPELPVTPESALDKRIDWRYVDLRRPDRRLIFEVQTTAEAAMREYWRRDGFIEIHSPKFMGSASRVGRRAVPRRYFDGDAYLAQSPQFYKQMAMAAGFERVCEIGPVFRANPSFTSRHDTEFTSVDVEIAWVESHEDVMAFEEAWLTHVMPTWPSFTATRSRRSSARRSSCRRFRSRGSRSTTRRLELQQAGHASARRARPRPAERAGAVGADRRAHGHEFVFVTDYPTTVRPFYHMRHEDDPTLTKSFDLLWRGIEITTGAQREHRLERLLAQAEDKKVDVGPIGYYLDFFRYGAPPHGGLGFGLTRLLMQLLGQENVREVTFLYRGPHRLEP